MPKPTKKSTKKPPSKSKKGFWSKLVPRTPKSQVLVFLAVFAAIGGGFMAYRSFAAQGAGVYTVDKLEKDSGNVSFYTESNNAGAKSGTRVLALQSNGSSASSIRIKDGAQQVIWAPFIKVCANVAVAEPGRNASVSLDVVAGSRAGGGNTYTISGTHYRKICSQQMNHSDANAKVGGRVFHNQTSGANLRVKVASMSIEYNNTGW